MKTFILSLGIILSSALAYAQGCSSITPGSEITKLAPGLYKLSVNFAGNGQKHLDVTFYEGTTVISNILSTTCIPINGSGTVSVNFVNVGNDPRAVIVPGTGNCGGGSPCPSEAATISYASTGALPISIETFYAKRNNNLVTLNWKTLLEVNAKQFIVQRNSGYGYVDIKTIPSTNKPGGDSYMITDNNTNNSTTLYRLKLVDQDGSSSLSETRTVKGTVTKSDYTIFPNPSTGNGKVSITDISEPTDVHIIDNSGRIIKNVSIFNNSFELTNVQSGTYQIRLKAKTGGSVVIRKLTVVN